MAHLVGLGDDFVHVGLVEYHAQHLHGLVVDAAGLEPLVHQSPLEQPYISPGDAGERPVLEEGIEVLPEDAFPIPPGGLLENFPCHPIGKVPVEGWVLQLRGKDPNLGAVGEVFLVLKDAVGNLGVNELDKLLSLFEVVFSIL